MPGRARNVVLIGESAPIAALRREIEVAARSRAKVLITGETGVGKEVVARLIHESSARHHAPFVALNCGGLPDTLLSSELFGHRRGSFTGAYRDKQGLVRRAEGGTLFLDEVGEMSVTMQALLLRFAESGEIQPLGAELPSLADDVRLIAATNRDLRAQMQAGVFREDLFYRLHVTAIRVPPLRERGADALLLMRHYMAIAAGPRKPVPEITPDAAQLLIAYGWPGNVRELRNVAERLILAERTTVDAEDLPPEIREHWTVVLEPLSGDPPTSTATQAHLVDVLWQRLLDGEDFWSVVGESYKARELTRTALGALIDRGLQQTGGSYRQLVSLFNLPQSDYKRFHGYLYQRHSHLPVRPYRRASSRRYRA